MALGLCKIMNRPTWFIAALLGFLAAIVGTQLYSLQRSSYVCASYMTQLRERLDRTEPGTPKALQVAQVIESTNRSCRAINDDLKELNANYLDTTLALLGGAGVVAGAVMGMGRNERRQLRRTDPSAPVTGDDHQQKDPQQHQGQDDKQQQ